MTNEKNVYEVMCYIVTHVRPNIKIKSIKSDDSLQAIVYTTNKYKQNFKK